MIKNGHKLLVAQRDILADPRLLAPFRDIGFAVDEATTAAQACSLVEEKQYSAAVLGTIMPPGEAEGRDISAESTLHGGLQVLRSIARLKKKPAVWVVKDLPDTEIEDREELLFLIQYVKERLCIGDARDLAERIWDYLSVREPRPDELAAMLRSRAIRSLHDVFAVVGQGWGFSALGLASWHTGREALVDVAGGFWCKSSVEQEVLLSAFSREFLVQANIQRRGTYVETTWLPSRQVFRQVYIGAMMPDNSSSTHALPDGSRYLLCYAEVPRTTSILTIPELPLTNERCAALNSFLLDYRLLPEVDRTEPPGPIVARLMEHAVMHTSVRPQAAKVQKMTSLPSEGFDWQPTTGEQPPRRVDPELLRNQEGYKEFNKSLPPELKGRWLVFGDGKFIADGDSQRETMLKAREKCGQKDLRLFLFKGGEPIQRLEFVPGTMRLKRE